MLALLSPAKTLDMDAHWPDVAVTQPAMLDEAKALIAVMRGYSVSGIRDLMRVSEKIATLNHGRYRAFSLPFTPDNATPALFAFRGDVYEGFDVAQLSTKDLAYAQDHLAILSGLYGVLRPLDLMQPYRLEMATRLKTKRGHNLYDYWGERITDGINAMLGITRDRHVINLASSEYFKGVRPEKLKGKWITVHFKEYRGGAYKVIGLMAKKARGRMARYMVQERCKTPDALTAFEEDGYAFQPAFSSDDTLVFTRG